MRKLVCFSLLLILYSAGIDAGCRGCCSHHGGVTCHEGVTQCQDGSALSSKCQAKSCNKCPGKARYSNQSTEKSQTKINQNEYNRLDYGSWVDKDGDCQNTRAEILISTSKTEPKFKTEEKCLVVSGKWIDPYSGKSFTDASDLDIDHVIPLRAAHDYGAKNWSENRRESFVNDHLNLIPVWNSLNRQKGAKGPKKWMPPNKKYTCKYLKRWHQVKEKYELEMPSRDIASFEKKARECPSLETGK